MPDNAELAANAATQLRERLESNAGASFVGPDARTLRFSFDRQENYSLSYLTVILDGFNNADEATREMFTFALTHAFNVLGNAVNLTRRADFTRAASYPQGSILIWRGGHTPLFGADAEGVWSVQMTYCLLPPFAHVIS